MTTNVLKLLYVVCGITETLLAVEVLESSV